MSTDLRELKNSIVQCAQSLVQAGLVKGTGGNISARVSSEHFVVTPSGIPYLSLEESDIVEVDLSGKVVQGEKKPSTEWPFHLGIYKNRPDIGGVVHTHSPYATSFACCGKTIPVIVPEFAMFFGKELRVAPYATAGTETLSRRITETLGRDGRAVLLENHGVLAVGSSVNEARIMAEMIEEVAMVATLAESHGGANVLPEPEIELLFARQSGYGQ